MTDKDLYLEAEVEFDSDFRDKALWSKSLTLNSGDEKKAKYTYIGLRVEELSSRKPNKTKIIKKRSVLTDINNSFIKRVLIKTLFTVLALIIFVSVWPLLFGESDFSVNGAVGFLGALIISIWLEPWSFLSENYQKPKTKIENPEDTNDTKSKEEKELKPKEKTIPTDKFEFDPLFWALLIIPIFLVIYFTINGIY